MESENAPILESKGLLQRSLNKKLRDEKNVSNGNHQNKTEIVDSKMFESKGIKFVIASVAEGAGGYIDIMKGSGNSVGSLMKSQRIVINSRRQNFQCSQRDYRLPNPSLRSFQSESSDFHRSLNPHENIP